MIICPECDKEIYAVNKFETKKGIEVPTLIHNTCYDRLKTLANNYLFQLNKATEWARS